ncbi:MAG: nuclear transport factor 2 family protein [Algibacter sp.]
MKKLLFIACLFTICFCHAQSNEAADKKAIQTVLKKQRIAWSKGNIDAFMEGYWKSDSLKFYGSSGLTSGWHNTLEKYEKGYPTIKDMGVLNFKINDISKISDDSYYVMGEYHLKRTIGNANGIFMIIFKKINGKWKIIADTSC